MPKLAEALVQRKQLQERFQRLCARITTYAKVQEGDQPDELPDVLIAEAEQVLLEIKRLVIDINYTNVQTRLEGTDLTLMEAIAQRDYLRSEKQMLDMLGNAARIEPQRAYGATRNEVKWHATVSVPDVQKQIDRASQAYRELDTQIQAANWSTDLIEKQA